MNDILEKVQCCAENDPLDTVLVSLTQGLPDGFFLGYLASDANSSSTTVWTWGVLLYLSKFDALWGYIMTGISKVEHAALGFGFDIWKSGRLGESGDGRESL